VSFSYPYGVVTGLAESAVKQAGFVCAVTTESGANRDPFDRYRIRRIPSGGYRLRHYARALRVLFDSRLAVSAS
jgi:hypothetical protein